jgi:hypothetical protein
MGSRMFDAARAMVLASFPADLSEIEIRGRLCERIYGQEVDLTGFIAHLNATYREPNPSANLSAGIEPTPSADQETRDTGNDGH